MELGMIVRRVRSRTAPLDFGYGAPMTRPTQLVLLFAGAFGALTLGASFGSAQQVPPAAQPAPANASPAPGNNAPSAPSAVQPPPAVPPAAPAPAAPASAQQAPAAAKPT